MSATPGDSVGAGRGEEVVLRRADARDRTLLAALYGSYLEELARFDADIQVNAPLQDDWFAKPDVLHPYLVLRGGRAVGFLFVLSGAFARSMAPDSERYVFDLYVRPEVRGVGVAEAAVAAAFADAPGAWCLEVHEVNQRAVAFWTRVLATHAQSVRERRGRAEGKRALRFRIPRGQ